MPSPVPSILAAVVVLALSAGATTAPSTAPTTAPHADALGRQVAGWFDGLADADPAVRDAAAQSLMGLGGADLPKLLAVVRAAGVVRPAQAAALHEVVCQVFLAAEPYVAVHDDDDPLHAADPHYVMGIHWPADQFEAGPRLGVPVVERWPGFPARRLLRDGDLILGVYLDPAAPLMQLPNMMTPRPEALREAVTRAGGTRRVTLSVLRAGRTLAVPLTLVPQPVDASSQAAMPADVFLEARQQRAESYWQATFAPLVEAAGDDDPATSVDP